MDGTYQAPRKNALVHAARLLAGGWVQTYCNPRRYARDANFTAGNHGFRVTCKTCGGKLPQRPPPAGAWLGPTVYCTRGDLLTMGLLQQINRTLTPLALFAELQADGTLRILDYRHLPDQAAALAEVVRSTKRKPPR